MCKFIEVRAKNSLTYLTLPCIISPYKKGKDQMIIHIVLNVEDGEVVFMSPSNVAYGNFVRNLFDEMVSNNHIDRDADLHENDILEMYGNWYYDVYNTEGIEGWQEGNR